VTFLPGELEVVLDHAAHELVDADAGLPAEPFARLAGVAAQGLDFGGAVVAGVDPDVLVCQSRSRWPKTFSTKVSRTLWVWPVAIT
jgi:hypothetical protein